MTADSSTTDLPESSPLPDIPPAAQWMADMAAQSPPTTDSAIVTQPDLPVSSLEDRHQRISSSLRSSKKLLPAMAAETREALLAWGEEIAWTIVMVTEGMDDAAAEDILQPRIRALRRLLQRVGQMIANPEEFEADSIRYIAKQVGLMTGQDVLSQVTDQIVADVWSAWQQEAGAPLAQIEIMRRFVAELQVTSSGEAGAT